MLAMTKTTPTVARPATRLLSFAFALAALLTAMALPGPHGTVRAQDQVQKFGDWSYGCDTSQEGTNDCVIYQELLDPSNNQPVARLTVIKVAEATRPVLIATTPLGVMLQPGLKLFVDQKEIGSMPFQVCIQPGCRSEVEMPEELLQHFKSGVSGALQIMRPDGKPISAPFSLKGFTAGLEALQ